MWCWFLGASHVLAKWRTRAQKVMCVKNCDRTLETELLFGENSSHCSSSIPITTWHTKMIWSHSLAHSVLLKSYWKWPTNNQLANFSHVELKSLIHKVFSSNWNEPAPRYSTLPTTSHRGIIQKTDKIIQSFCWLWLFYALLPWTFFFKLGQ